MSDADTTTRQDGEAGASFPASWTATAPSREPVPRSIAAALQRSILDGELGPGAQLPSQRDLSEHFGVSRASLREAFSVLEAQGLIQVQPGRGVFVSTEGERRTLWPYSHRASARDAYEARLALEAQAASLAAARVDEQGLRRLAATVDTLAQAGGAGDIDGMAAADAAFHDTMLELSGNPLIASMYRSVREVMVASQSLPMTAGTGLEDTVAEHRAILELLRHGRGEEAAAAMTAHIRAAAKRAGIDV